MLIPYPGKAANCFPESIWRTGVLCGCHKTNTKPCGVAILGAKTTHTKNTYHSVLTDSEYI